MELLITHNYERTLERTIKRSEEFGFKVYPVHDVPQYKTVTKAFKLALSFRSEWFALMGGDQYLTENARNDIDNYIRKVTNNNIWKIQGYGFDYLWQKARNMSPSIYRTKYIKNVLKIPLDKNVIRPEEFIGYKMEEMGYKYIVDKNFQIANHDFDQYYKDIYRKGYFQASKRSKKWIRKISKIKNKSMDHVIFIQGIDDYLNGTKTDIFKKFNIKEKKSYESINVSNT